MTRFGKIATAGLAVFALGLGTIEVSTPASARGGFHGGGFHGGGFHGGGFRGGGFRGGRGWGGRGWGGWGWGAAAGGLALGALAAGAYYDGYGYGYGSCVARQAVYDSWGNFVGYRRVYVAC